MRVKAVIEGLYDRTWKSGWEEIIAISVEDLKANCFADGYLVGQYPDDPVSFTALRIRYVEDKKKITLTKKDVIGI